MREKEAGSAEVTHPVPWLTYGLVLVCVGAFLFSEKAAIEADAVIAADISRADEYLREHPYLSVPPLLESHLSSQTKAALQGKPGKGRASAAVLSRLLAREQAELDAWVDAAQRRLDQLPARQQGFRASDPTLRTILVHPLLHGGWLHLIGNLLLLVVLGYFLEGAFRVGVFPALAAAGVAGSAIGYAMINVGYAEPLIGASGLLAGLLGAYTVRFWSDHEGVPYASVVIVAPLLLALPAVFGFEWSVSRAADAAPVLVGAFNPSAWALVGGFTGGCMAALGAKLLGLERSGRGAEAADSTASCLHDPQYLRALDLQRVGQLEAAFNVLTGVSRRFPDDIQASAVLWDVAVPLGRQEAASAAILRVIREELTRGDFAKAVQHWLEVLSCDLDGGADAALLLRVAPLLRDGGHFDEAARTLRAALDLPVDSAAASQVATRVAQAAAEFDPATARDAAWRALRSPVLDIEARHALESLLSEVEPQIVDDAGGPAASETLAPDRAVSNPGQMAPEEADSLVDAADRGALPNTPAAIELDESSRVLECLIGVPIGQDDEGLIIELEDGVKECVPFESIEAIAVAAVDGIVEKTVVIVDLVLNWVSLTGEPLRLIRLRTDRYDPCQLVPETTDRLQAVRVLVARLLEDTAAIPLPDLQSVKGTPFAAFSSLNEYQTHVLMVGDGTGLI